MNDRKFVIRGKHNELLSTNIGNGTIVSGWTFIGENVVIGKNCRLGNFMDINSDSIIEDNVNIQAFAEINSGTIIGEGTMIGAKLSTADEKYMNIDTNSIIRKPCRIGKNNVIGISVTLVSVKLGNNVVIGARSLVLKDVPDNEVWIGSPAKFLMTRSEFDKKEKDYQKNIIEK